MQKQPQQYQPDAGFEYLFLFLMPFCLIFYWIVTPKYRLLFLVYFIMFALSFLVLHVVPKPCYTPKENGLLIWLSKKNTKYILWSEIYSAEYVETIFIRKNKKFDYWLLASRELSQEEKVAIIRHRNRVSTWEDYGGIAIIAGPALNNEWFGKILEERIPSWKRKAKWPLDI